MITFWQCVRRALQFGCLPECLCEQLPVRAWCGLVFVPPYSEHFHGRCSALLKSTHFLSQERRERHDWAEEYHTSHLFWDEFQKRCVKGDARTFPKTKENDILPIKAIVP